jgi:hypothetical protein
MRENSKGSRKAKLEDAYARYIEEKAWVEGMTFVRQSRSTINLFLRQQRVRVVITNL